MAGAVDLNASQSTSSSATSGVSAGRSGGDIYYNRSKPTPVWVWLALGGLALVALVIWKRK